MVSQAMRTCVRRACALVAASAAMLAVGATANVGVAAAAEAPAWKLVTITNPTNLVPESPRDEVQRVTVDATGGTFTLSSPNAEGERVTATQPIAYNATAGEVQTALEALPGFYHQLTVEGEGTGETSPYKVTFSGGSVAGRPQYVLKADGSELTGGSATASVVELSRGQFEPELLLTATNVGGGTAEGGTITLTDTLPAGVTVKSVVGWDNYTVRLAVEGFPLGGRMTCGAAGQTLTCTYTGSVMPGDALVLRAQLSVAAGAESGVDAMSVSGDGASSTASRVLTVSSTPARFGAAPGTVFAAISSSEAGGHPDMTTMFAMNMEEKGVPAADPEDIRFNLPPGLVGQAVGMQQCSMSAVMEEDGKTCPSNTIVGMATVSIFVRVRGGLSQHGEAPLVFTVPVFNIAPAPGEPVAFAFNAIIPVRLDTSVLSNGKYGVRVTVPAIGEAAGILSTSVTIWGVPSELNGAGPYLAFHGAPSFGGSNTTVSHMPLLTSPQQCGAELTATMETDSWEAPGVFEAIGPLPMGTLTGCDQLRFEPSFTMVPDTFNAGAPAGYDFRLNVPQHNEVGRPATPNVNSVKLTLPAGTVINPSAAWGLKACSNEQFYGPPISGEEPAQPAKCPRESQVGTVSIKTPALEETLEGHVYLATPECAVCTPENAEHGEMVRLFVNVLGNGEGGVVVKLEGRGYIKKNGQIETLFKEDPQLPFSEFNLELGGGPRAVLANPRVCGPVSSSLNMASWDGALPEAALTYGFEVNEGCFGPQFNPSFSAGMPNIQAGAHGEFTLAFGRSDKDQFLKQITLKMPPGLLGTLKGIPLCAEAQANAGTCGAGSLIGEAQVLTGPGADPFLVEGGKVYLTEGYGGSQFGLSIVVPAVAGPYTLAGTTGHGTVVVRSQLFIDAHTAQITAVSGPMPSMLDGIPLQLRAVNVKLNRPGFMFNPTSCAKMAITGSIVSQEGMSADVSEPFQVTNCARLPFHPTLTAITRAHHTRKKGAYLHVVVKSGPGQANLRYVRVELPKALPSELKTLQHACTEEQFAKNPAGCPAESVVGHARAVTPVLPVPLTGPAYFVSHGGKKFPELIVVLQGYGVTVDLAGETFISKAGVTSSTFKTVPDVPVSRFDLVLPQREYSALGATTNFCKHPQKMPTRIVAQSGKVIEHDTPIQVSGCGTFIAVRAKHVHGGKATILLHASSAGKLTANGKGIAKVSKRVKKGGRVGITVQLKAHFRKMLRHSHSHHVKVHVHLTFKAKHGKGHAKAEVTVKLK